MGRGILSGLIWGALIMVVAVTLLSLNAPLPDRPAPIAVMLDGNADTGSMPAVDAAVPGPDTMTDAGPAVATNPAPVVTGPASEIPLPSGSEFNRPPEERIALLPGIDSAPATMPTAITQLPSPVTPPAPNTTSAPQPIATATLQAPSETSLTESSAPVPAQSDDPLPPPPELQPAPLGLPTVDADPAAQTTPPVEGSPLQRLTSGDQTPATPVTIPNTPAESAADIPAIEAFSTPFDATETRPLMAVILIDDPSFPLGRSALTRFDFPVSFAIDPSRADAAEAAAEYRAAGFEVVFLAAGLSPESSAEDVTALLNAGLVVLPEAVAILDTSAGVIQSNRPVLETVVAFISDTGHGLVAYPRGLNVAQQTATRSRVPADTLFREIDSERERATVITRYLDRAAFSAGQEGHVIVLGHTYSDTVTALFSWALGSRSEGVALAPLSAVLTR